MDKKSWVEPKLEVLEVTETLGGPFLNFPETLLGQVTPGGPANVPVGSDFS